MASEHPGWPRRNARDFHGFGQNPRQIEGRRWKKRGVSLALAMRHFPNFFELTAGAAIGLALRYAAGAGLAWLLAYVFFKRRWIHRKIIARFPESSEVWREIRYSALSVVIFGLVGAGTVGAAR